MKNLTKKGKIIALVGALVLVCITSGVTMYTTGVLTSHSKGETNWKDYCINDKCDCHDTLSWLTKCGKCPKCYKKDDTILTE